MTIISDAGDFRCIDQVDRQTLPPFTRADSYQQGNPMLYVVYRPSAVRMIQLGGIWRVAARVIAFHVVLQALTFIMSLM